MINMVLDDKNFLSTPRVRWKFAIENPSRLSWMFCSTENILLWFFYFARIKTLVESFSLGIKGWPLKHSFRRLKLLPGKFCAPNLRSHPQITNFHPFLNVFGSKCKLRLTLGDTFLKFMTQFAQKSETQNFLINIKEEIGANSKKENIHKSDKFTKKKKIGQILRSLRE